MGVGSLREAGGEGAEGGIPKGVGAGRNGKNFATLARYFAIGKAHRGRNCYGRGREPGVQGAGCGRREVQTPLSPPAQFLDYFDSCILIKIHVMKLNVLSFFNVLALWYWRLN